MEKASYIWGAHRQRTSLVRPKTHMAIHPRSEEWGILAFSRNSSTETTLYESH
jgi:hypothetical protein